MTAGQQFVKMLKPLGCIIFLGLFVGFLVLAFTAKPPVEGYVKPQNAEYYAEHLDEFKTELETNLFPKLDGVESCRIAGDKLEVEIKSENFDDTSKALTHYYGKDIFTLERVN